MKQSKRRLERLERATGADGMAWVKIIIARRGARMFTPDGTELPALPDSIESINMFPVKGYVGISPNDWPE